MLLSAVDRSVSVLPLNLKCEGAVQPSDVRSDILRLWPKGVHL